MGPTDNQPAASHAQAVLKAGRHSTSDLFPVVYQQMRALAARRLRHVKAGHTLQATALVHEVYLRLTGGAEPKWDGERHFFAAAARAMREILVDRARSKSRRKRGGDRRRIDLSDYTFEEPIGVDDEFLLAIDAVLLKLEELDARRAEIVTLKYFAGLTTQQAARCMGVSERTLEREWQFARVWLHRELTEHAPSVHIRRTLYQDGRRNSSAGRTKGSKPCPTSTR